VALIYYGEQKVVKHLKESYCKENKRARLKKKRQRQKEKKVSLIENKERARA